MSKSFKNLLKKLDYSGIPVNLRDKGDHVFKTAFGGVSTLI